MHRGIIQIEYEPNWPQKATWMLIAFASFVKFAYNIDICSLLSQAMLIGKLE